MSLKHRLQCLQWLKEIGYQTGTGIMVGTPGQTLTHLVEDLLFIEQFQPQMIGIGPFIPHHDTPFGTEPAGSVGMTLKLLSPFPVNAPVRPDSIDHRPCHLVTGRTGKRNIGRS